MTKKLYFPLSVLVALSLLLTACGAGAPGTDNSLGAYGTNTPTIVPTNTPDVNAIAKSTMDAAKQPVDYNATVASIVKATQGVQPSMPVKLTVTTDKTQYNVGDDITISWTAQNATSCTLGGDLVNESNVPISGTKALKTNFAGLVNVRMSCGGPGGTDSYNSNFVVHPLPTAMSTSTPAAPASVNSQCGDATVTGTAIQGTKINPLLKDGSFSDQWNYTLIKAEDVDGVAKPFWGFVQVQFYADLMIPKMAVTVYSIKANSMDAALCLAKQMAGANETIVFFGSLTPDGVTTTAPDGWTTTVRAYPNVGKDIWGGNNNYSGFDILIKGEHKFACTVNDFCYTQEWNPGNEGEAWHTITDGGYMLTTPALQGHGGIFSNPPLDQGADPIGNFMQDSARKVVLDSIKTLHTLFCGPAAKAPSGWLTTMPDGFTCKAN